MIETNMSSGAIIGDDGIIYEYLAIPYPLGMGPDNHRITLRMGNCSMSMSCHFQQMRT